MGPGSDLSFAEELVVVGMGNFLSAESCGPRKIITRVAYFVPWIKETLMANSKADSTDNKEFDPTYFTIKTSNVKNNQHILWMPALISSSTKTVPSTLSWIVSFVIPKWSLTAPITSV